MNMLETLERLAINTPVQNRGVRGQWCALRLQLDRATGDTLNVGVMFTPEEGPRSWRLLKSFGGLRCLYGPEGAANAAFAVDQANSVLSRGEELPLGWTIAAGPKLYTQGASARQVVETLYSRVVPLARHELLDEDRLDSDDHRLSTGQLRRRVRNIIRRRFGAGESPDFWRDTPVNVSTSDGRALSLDLQVWLESGTAVGVMGAVTSAWYTSKFHRDSYLNNSYRALTEARQVAGGMNSKAGLFVLRPMSDSRFSESQLHAIDNEIDELSWLLGRVNVDVHTYDNEETLAESVLTLA